MNYGDKLTPGAWVYVGLHEGKKYRVKQRAEQQTDIPNIAMRAVCNSFDVDLDEMKSKSRLQTLAFARHAYCSMVRKFTRLTLKEIGQTLGGRDHATVVNSCRVSDNLLEYDDVYRQMYEEALDLLISECGMLAHMAR